MSRLLIAKREAIATETKFNRIAQRCPAEDFYLCTAAKSHFEQSATQFRIAAHTDDVSAASDA
jgi:hypothetical protein